MQTMRRAGAVCAAASTALVLAACGQDPEATGGANQSSGSVPAGGAQANVECGGKNPLSGEGSSAQKTAIDIFTMRYGNQCEGQQVNYNPSGSGAGVKQFNANQVDFAGTDSSLKQDKGEVAAAAQRCGSEAWNLPLVVGPVAIAFKLDGVDKLTLTPEVTAKIFNGQITNWNDPAIASLKGNEGVRLPDKPIQVISRADDSGTTDNFQKYLSAASKGAWTQGDGKQFKGGVGNGAEKSNGVIENVKSGDGAITYVEAAYAKEGVSTASIDSGSGPVELTPQHVAKAVETAKFKKEGSKDLALDLESIYRSNTPGAYPLLLTTYEVVCSRYANPEVGKAVRAFLSVAATDGQQPLSTKGFVPIPANLQQKVLESVKAIR